MNINDSFGRMDRAIDRHLGQDIEVTIPGEGIRTFRGTFTHETQWVEVGNHRMKSAMPILSGSLSAWGEVAKDWKLTIEGQDYSPTDWLPDGVSYLKIQLAPYVDPSSDPIDIPIYGT